MVAITAQPMIACTWRSAWVRPEATLGSPPRNRSSAAEISAALKKMPMKVVRKKIEMPSTTSPAVIAAPGTSACTAS